MFESGWMVGKLCERVFVHMYTPTFRLSYDMVHFGHANACRQAKLMGTHLVVGVHSDGRENESCCFMIEL